MTLKPILFLLKYEFCTFNKILFVLKLKHIPFILLFTFLSCNEEPYGSIADEDSDSNQTEVDFFPTEGYWIYEVNSNSEVAQDMNFTAKDSVYVDQINENYFSLAANNGDFANGSMNMILTNADLYDTPSSLTLDGSLSLPENLSTFGISEDFSLEDLIIFDLDADNGQIMFSQDGVFSNSFEIQNNEVPIEVDYEIETTKINFHDNVTLNATEYNNVFQGKLAISLSVSGTFSVLGFSQTITILETQDIISVNYYYAESIGLVRAESFQGFSFSPQLISLLDLLGNTLDIPSSLSIQNIEELSTYSTD